MDWIFRSAVEIAEAVSSGTVSAEEVVEEHLGHIEERNSEINALVVVDFEGARSAARAIDLARRRGETLGPLAGVPVSIKEAFASKNDLTTCGMEDFRDTVTDFDAPAVTALREAGAVICGKTNVPAALAGFQCNNALYGQTLNPWNLAHTPGGSSGGSGAAVAAGLTVLDLASDLSGSIRIPAAWCGVTGLRPSYGLLSKRGHLPWPLDGVLEPPESVVGVLARDVDDLDLAWRTLSATSHSRALATSHRGTQTDTQWKIAAWMPSEDLLVDRSTGATYRAAIESLERCGHIVMPFEPPEEPAEIVALARRLTDGEITHGLSEQVWQGWDQPAFSIRRYFADLEKRERLRAVYDLRLAEIDALICPATPISAPALDAAPFQDRNVLLDGAMVQERTLANWSLVISVVQLPSVTIPIGCSPDGLPVGMQVVSRASNYVPLLQIASGIFSLLGSIGRPPGW